MEVAKSLPEENERRRKFFGLIPCRVGCSLTLSRDWFGVRVEHNGKERDFPWMLMPAKPRDVMAEWEEPPCGDVLEWLKKQHDGKEWIDYLPSV